MKNCLNVQNSFLFWNRGSIIHFFLAFLSQFHAEFCELHSYCVHFGSCKQHFLNSIYYDSKLLGIINYGTFNSLLAGLGGNQVDRASCPNDPYVNQFKPRKTEGPWVYSCYIGSSAWAESFDLWDHHIPQIKWQNLRNILLY